MEDDSVVEVMDAVDDWVLEDTVVLDVSVVVVRLDVSVVVVRVLDDVSVVVVMVELNHWVKDVPVVVFMDAVDDWKVDDVSVVEVKDVEDDPVIEVDVRVAVVSIHGSTTGSSTYCTCTVEFMPCSTSVA